MLCVTSVTRGGRGGLQSQTTVTDRPNLVTRCKVELVDVGGAEVVMVYQDKKVPRAAAAQRRCIHQKKNLDLVPCQRMKVQPVRRRALDSQPRNVPASRSTELATAADAASSAVRAIPRRGPRAFAGTPRRAGDYPRGSVLADFRHSSMPTSNPRGRSHGCAVPSRDAAV